MVRSFTKQHYTLLLIGRLYFSLNLSILFNNQSLISCGVFFSPRDDFESDHAQDVLMPPIPEEMSRVNSLASIEYLRDERPSQQMDRSFDIVKEATEVLQEMTESTSVQDRWKANEGKGYESCCSNASSDARSDDSCDEIPEQKLEREDVVVTIEDKKNERTTSNKE